MYSLIFLQYKIIVGSLRISWNVVSVSPILVLLKEKTT